MKDALEMVWPMEDYTNKIHSSLNIIFNHYNWLSFTESQLEEHLTKGLSWLTVENDRQRQVLHKIINTGVKKLIQLGKVVKVCSKTSVESQWIAAKTASESGYIKLTQNEDVAKTEAARKFVSNRAVNKRTLWELNKA
jgi:hypothetical protein